MPWRAPVECAGPRNPASAKFCGTCGNRLDATVGADADPVAGAQLSTSSSTPGGRHRPAASRLGPLRRPRRLHADGRGNSTPEDVRDLLEPLFRRPPDDRRPAMAGQSRSLSATRSWRVWGAPVAHEDDAERAVRAALEIVDAVGRSTLGAGLERAGRRRSPARRRHLRGARQGMVVGDLVNTAARLQSVAAPGTVLVGEATYRAASARDRLRGGRREIAQGQGAAGPRLARRRASPPRGGEGRSAAAGAAVRRARRRAAVAQGPVHAAEREGEPRLVTIVGTGGHRQEQARVGVREVPRRCRRDDPVVRGSLARLRRGDQLLGARRDGPPARRDRRLRRRGYRPSPAIGDCSTSIVADDDGAPLDPAAADRPARRGRLPAGPARSSSPPGAPSSSGRGAADDVLVFEDLQWADQGLLDFIEHLLTWARTSPIMVIAEARPELYERRPGWGATVRSSTSIRVEPLSVTRDADAPPRPRAGAGR